MAERIKISKDGVEEETDPKEQTQIDLRSLIQNDGYKYWYKNKIEKIEARLLRDLRAIDVQDYQEFCRIRGKLDILDEFKNIAEKELKALGK